MKKKKKYWLLAGLVEIWVDSLYSFSFLIFCSYFLTLFAVQKKKKFFSLFFNAFLKRLQKQRPTPQITSQKCIIFLLLTTSPWNCQLSQRSVIDITLWHSNIRLNTLFGCSEKKKWLFVFFHYFTQIWTSFGSSQREFKIHAVSMTGNESSNNIPKAPIFLPEGPWKQVINLSFSNFWENKICYICLSLISLIRYVLRYLCRFLGELLPPRDSKPPVCMAVCVLKARNPILRL